MWELINRIFPQTKLLIANVSHATWLIMKDAWEKIKDSVTKYINGTVENVQGGLDNMRRTMVGAVKDFISAATDLGNGIVTGIIEGINRGVGAIKDAVKGAASAALDAAKSMLGISSPSKVFQTEIAGNIIKGMALGLKDTAPITSAMQNIAGLITNPVIASQMAGSVSNSNQTNWNVTINTAQPVNNVLNGLQLRQAINQ
jgi:phage-related protein